MRVATKAILRKAFEQEKKKKTPDYSAKSGQTPYSQTGKAIKKAGERERTSQRTQSLNDYRLSHIPEEIKQSYIHENGIDREDAALRKRDERAFNRQIGNTVSNNMQWAVKNRKQQKEKNKK